MTDFAARRVMMVDTQVRPSDVTKFPIIEAMLAIPREDFVPDVRRDAAYVGETIDIGHGRALIEARSLAKMLDALAIGPQARVLVIGAGTGYGAAILGRMAAHVTALEQDSALADHARKALAAIGATNVEVITAPLIEGAAKAAPFDFILIEGGIASFPQALAAQLAPGGRIAAIFMEGALGTVRIGHREPSGRIAWRFAFNAAAPVLPGFAAQASFAL